MNGHELWRLRELGLSGFQVQKQESNFWSKYNCPVLQWTAENPRHGFIGSDTAPLTRSEPRDKRDRITISIRRDSSCKRSTCASSEPPAKQLKLEPSTSQEEADLRNNSATNASTSAIDQMNQRLPGYRGNWYFINSNDSLRGSCAAVFPQFAQERHIDLGQYNKIFAARWLSDDRIVMGTKCNSILIMDADNRKSKRERTIRRQILDEDNAEESEGEGYAERYIRSPAMSPTSLKKVRPLRGSGDIPQNEPNCGIHAIDVNPSGTLFASGANNPADVSVFRLPNFEPLTVGETAHSDWLFDLEWLDDEYLVSGSRDSTLALWRFPSSQEDMIVCSHSSRFLKSRDHSGPSSGGYVGTSHNYRSPVSSSQECVSYPSSRPIVVKKLNRFDKVRALKFNHRWKVLTSVSLNSYLHVLDVTTFRQRLLRRMEGYHECVCLCNSPDEDLLTVGSRTSFAFYDTRTWEKVGDEKLPRRMDEEPHSVQSMMPSGVRSVSWRDHMLTLGTGGGEIMFYDVRARKFLQCDCNRSLTLKITGGWLQQDEVYQEIFLNLPCPNAVYAHCYDEYGTRLFAAGGPIAASLVGNYAAMWG